MITFMVDRGSFVFTRAFRFVSAMSFYDMPSLDRQPKSRLEGAQLPINAINNMDLR